MSYCTCAQCGETFASLKAFDAHQQVDFTATPPVVCKPPGECGMVLKKRVWHAQLSPGGSQRLAQLSAQRKENTRRAP